MFTSRKRVSLFPLMAVAIENSNRDNGIKTCTTGVTSTPRTPRARARARNVHGPSVFALWEKFRVQIERRISGTYITYTHMNRCAAGRRCEKNVKNPD